MPLVVHEYELNAEEKIKDNADHDLELIPGAMQQANTHSKLAQHLAQHLPSSASS